MMHAREERIDRYAVVAPIGRGGMGEVHRAFDPRLRRQLAIKLVSGSADPRFLREAQAMAQLSHPNVVQVYDAGIAGDRVWIAMELIDGVDLRAWLRARPRGWREVLDRFIEAGRGLAAAHAVGIVHRDFKPGNALVSRDGRVVVGDFGLARPVAMAAGSDVGERTLTLSQPGKGTPKYMAPEQAVGGVVDARADQYSFCVALIEALDASGAPDRVRAVALRGLVPNPAGRWRSMEGLIAALEEARVEPARRRSGAAWAWVAALVLVIGAMIGVMTAAGVDGAERVVLVSESEKNKTDDQAANHDREASLAAPVSESDKNKTDDQAANQNREALGAPGVQTEGLETAAKTAVSEPRRRKRTRRVRRVKRAKADAERSRRPEPDGLIRDLWSAK